MNRGGRRQGDRGAQTLGWLFERWRSTLEDIDKERVLRSVRKLEKAHPGDKEYLVRRVVRRSSRLSAGLGLASAAPALLPGLGTAVSVVAMVPEEIYMIRLKCVMMLRIAAIYGFDPAAAQRVPEILSLAGTSSRTLEALGVAKDDIQRLATRMTAGLARRTGQAGNVGTRTVGRGALRRLPAFGLLAGGAINYWSLQVTGRKAAEFYRQLYHTRASQ